MLDVSDASNQHCNPLIFVGKKGVDSEVVIPYPLDLEIVAVGLVTDDNHVIVEDVEVDAFDTVSVTVHVMV
jgi:hypothetical protein